MAKSFTRKATAIALMGAIIGLSACSTERVLDNTVNGSVAVVGYAAKGTYAVAKAGVKGTGAVVRAVVPGE